MSHSSPHTSRFLPTTPFAHSRYSGDPGAARILLDEGCDPTIVLPDNWEPLQQICANTCNAATIKLLLDHGARSRVDVRNPRGMCPLGLAVQKCNPDAVRVLLGEQRLSRSLRSLSDVQTNAK